MFINFYKVKITVYNYATDTYDDVADPPPVNGNTYTTTVTVPDHNKKYRFQVAGTNGQQVTDGVQLYSEWSDVSEAQASLPAAPTGINIPAADMSTTGTTGTDGASSLKLTWANQGVDALGAVVGETITAYKIHIKRGDNNWNTNPIVLGNVVEHTITGLEPNTGYRFKVQASNAAGYGAESAETSVVHTAPAKMLKPTAVALTHTSIKVTFEKPSGSSTITSYNLRQKTPDAAVWSAAVSITDCATATCEHVVNGLAADTAYVFDVTAINGADASNIGDASDASDAVKTTGKPVWDDSEGSPSPAEGTTINFYIGAERAVNNFKLRCKSTPEADNYILLQ